MMVRVGEGWDLHALVAQRPLVLGGVQVPFHLGLLGHSDADVLLHAITDALLGAAALGDIGRHFPDTDARFKGADSMLLLAEAARRVRAAGGAAGLAHGAGRDPALRHRLAALCPANAGGAQRRAAAAKHRKA